MPSTDRRDIAGLLAPHFPDMDGATSEEWAAFLDAKTGLETSPDMPNRDAFDAWRQALAARGHEGVWGYTPEQIEAKKALGEQRAAAAVEYRKKQEVAAQAELLRLKQIADAGAKEAAKTNGAVA